MDQSQKDIHDLVEILISNETEESYEVKMTKKINEVKFRAVYTKYLREMDKLNEKVNKLCDKLMGDYDKDIDGLNNEVSGILTGTMGEIDKIEKRISALEIKNADFKGAVEAVNERLRIFNKTFCEGDDEKRIVEVEEQMKKNNIRDSLFLKF